jgi:hypothetical protein
VHACYGACVTVPPAGIFALSTSARLPYAAVVDSAGPSPSIGEVALHERPCKCGTVNDEVVPIRPPR